MAAIITCCSGLVTAKDKLVQTITALRSVRGLRYRVFNRTRALVLALATKLVSTLGGVD